MALQLSTSCRNARLDAIETTISTSAILKIRTGAAPANSAAASGSKAMSGTWQDASADAAGTAAHFRIYDSGGTTCHIQGTVTATGGGGDMTVDNTSFA